MTARAPIPAAIRFEYQAPEGATIYCDECDDAHCLHVRDVEVLWEPMLEGNRFLGLCYSFRLTGEHPTCEVYLDEAVEPWLENMSRDSYLMIQAVENAIFPPGQETCRVWEVEG